MTKNFNHPIPYYFETGEADDTPLLRLGRRDAWTAREAMQGTCILGGTGSGKSSGSGKAIAHAFLKAGYGGLVLCATADEADTWMGYAKATGREKSFIRFNFMDYTLATLGRDGFEHITGAIGYSMAWRLMS